MAAKGDDRADEDIQSMKANDEKLLAVEKRMDEILSQKFELEMQVFDSVSALEKSNLCMFVYTGGMSVLLTIIMPFTASFASSILLMTLFLAITCIRVTTAKSQIARINIVMKNLAERLKEAKVEATALAALETKRRKILAAKVVDDEVSIIDIESFSRRAENICTARDFSDFERVFGRMIRFSWMIGVVYVPLVLFFAYINCYVPKQGHNSPSSNKPGMLFQSI